MELTFQEINLITLHCKKIIEDDRYDKTTQMVAENLIKKLDNYKNG